MFRSVRRLDRHERAGSLRWWHWCHISAQECKVHSVTFASLCTRQPPPGGGGWRDGAAAGVFQIITSGCGGGGSPWQPQCLQHPTTEGNRATEWRNPVLLLRTLGVRANGNGFRGHRQRNSAFAPPSLMELNKQPRIGNPRMYFLPFLPALSLSLSLW